jgi:hypothetical protein
MTARSVLWLALAAVGLPLLIEGTGGCTFSSPGAAPINDNAYTCGCTCFAPPRITSTAVFASSDDAEQSAAAMNLTDADLDLGAQIVGLRFQGCLPPGATIKRAYVVFRARENGSADTDLEIVGQLSPTAPTFSAASDDLSSRPATATIVHWTPGPWTAGSTQQTPDLTALIQELVDQPNWTTKSGIVLRFQGTGQRAASSFEDNFRPGLQVEWDPSMHTELPVCATPEIVAQNVEGIIPHDVANADCRGRVATTLESLARACGYAENCSCELANAAKGDATFDRDVCDNPCVANPVDASCADFDPSGFERCVMQTGNDATCKGYVSATHAGSAQPVCVATGTGAPQDSPYTSGSFFLGHRSTCEVTGTSHIEVGDREPTHDPETVGTVQILGDPCPGGNCKVAASFALAMDRSPLGALGLDPTFSDLSASADSKATTMLAGVDAVFGPDGVGGTGNGRRGSNGLAIGASNAAPLTVGIDWSGKICDLNGNVATTVDGENPDGTCAGDGATPCTADSPDCDDVGGPCEFEDQDIEEMVVDVSASGTLVNQPPSGSAGPDQTVECTSTSGASFTLNGTASDPDDNIAVVSWRKGRTGSEVSQALVHPIARRRRGAGLRAAPDRYVRADGRGHCPRQGRRHDATAALGQPVAGAALEPQSQARQDHGDDRGHRHLRRQPGHPPRVDLSNEPDNGLGDGDQPKDIQKANFGTDDRGFELRNERSGTGRGRISRSPIPRRTPAATGRCARLPS